MGRALLSPFGALLAEIRDEPRSARSARTASPAAAARPGLEADLRIETRVVSSPPRLRPSMARVFWTSSLLFHAVGIVLLIVLPLLRSDVLPAPVHEAHAFFAAPASFAVPVPPPPPAAARVPLRSAARPDVPANRPAPTSFAAVSNVPVPAAAATDPAPAALVEDAHPAAGEPGGTPGGLPGGIVGGVVGSVAPPPAPVLPVRVGGEIRQPKKIRDVSPIYPDLAVAAHVKGAVILECLVSPQGRVTDVKLMRGIPLLNESAMAAVKQWMYTPTLKDGVPVSVILTVTVKFDL
jgi:periplasmic protein TonB